MLRIRPLFCPRSAPVLIFLFLLFPLQYSVYAQEWAHRQEQNGIVLYESTAENEKEKNFMAVFTVAASLRSCISLLYYPQFHPSFMDGIATSELVSKTTGYRDSLFLPGR